MGKKQSYITVTDQFCGAGGNSQGVRRYARRMGGGLEVKMALNHWQLAIDTHNTNFPETLHDCTDVSACDPRRYPSTDILITSPECTTHSPAGGNTHKAHKKQMDLFATGKIDPATERSRATMWDVCRFAEYHNYNIIIVENVVEAKTRWALFDAWLHAMHVLGYNHKCVYLNSQHLHPTPQSRDRMYIVFWKKGNKAPDLEYKPLANCHKCERDVHSIQTWKNKQRQYGKYKQQYIYCCPTCSGKVEPYYYASFNCIDWSDLGLRIGDRKKALSPNTTKRIEYGLDKYKNRPFIVDSKQVTGVGYRVRDISSPLNTVHTQPATGIFMPFIIKSENASNIKTAYSVGDSTPTQCVRQTLGLIAPPPFIVDGNFDSKPSRTAEVTEPMHVMNTQNRSGLMVPPYLIEMNSTGECKPSVDPASTFTAGGVNQGLISFEACNSFIQAYYGGSNCVNHITDTIGTQTVKHRHSLVSYTTPAVDDCYYRMLKAPEVQKAMAFDDDYIILGNAKDQVKQLGNAVTPPAMEWLVGQCVKSLS